MDGTGVRVVKKETAGRQGKTEGLPAHTREAKLGCVFTQATWDKADYAIRDSDSTTYTGAIETAVEFGKRIYREAWKRGWSRAKKKAVIGDGAEWIWNLVAEHFPGTIQIVDLYHARQHLWEVARQLYPHEEVKQKAWMKVHRSACWTKGKSKNWWVCYGPSAPPIPKWPRRFVPRQTTSKEMRSVCAIPSFAASTCLLARVQSKLDARR
jgi:hypothetical protein